MRDYHMTWEPAKTRWRKMKAGKLFVVSCEQLGLPEHLWTKEGSYRAANKWWQEKTRDKVQEALDSMPSTTELDEIIDRGEVARTTKHLIGTTGRLHAAKDVVGDDSTSFISDRTQDDTLATLSAAVDMIGANTIPRDRKVKNAADAFLEREKTGGMRPVSFRELKETVEWCYGIGLEKDGDVSKVSETTVDAIGRGIRTAQLSEGTKKKRFGFFKRFVKYCWEMRHLENLPRNLDSFKFEVGAVIVPAYATDHVRKVIVDMKPRFRLYALLGANCGMTNADIGRLTHDMVDLDEGTLTRRRGKTGENKNVPTVTYKLWKETVDLMRECQSSHETLFLTSLDGTSLWEQKHTEEVETARKDLLGLQWKRAKIKIPLKAFRSISATLLDGSDHARWRDYFLGHTAKVVGEKNYTAATVERQQKFDEAIDWLEMQFFPKASVTKASTSSGG